MPHVWNDIIVVTKNELVPAHWTESALKQTIQRYKDKDYGVQRVRLGGNGRQLLIAFDSLPKHVQNALGDPRKMNHVLEHFYATDKAAVDFYTNFQYPDGSYLPPNTAEQYITNASVFRALISLKSARFNERIAKGGSTRGVIQTLLNDAISFNSVLLKKYGVQHNIPTSARFAAKLNDFAERGYVSLIKDPNGTRKSNALKMDDNTVQLLNALFARQQHKPSPTEISNQYDAFLGGYLDVVNETTGEIYNPKQFKELSTASVTNYLSSWKSTTATHPIRNGNRQQLMQRFKPYHSLKQAQYAGSLLSIDDRQPPFEYQAGKRMWFYNAIDTGSEAFTCWVHGKSKEGIIMDFYRQLVRNYHEWGVQLPAGLECESSLNSSFKDTFLKQGAMFEHVRIEANNARGKRIEAYYKPLRYQIEKKREGWLARPFAKSEPNQLSNVKKQIIPYDTLTKECLLDIMTWNNSEHSKIKGKTRWEVFMDSQNPNLQPTNYKAFLPHIGYHTKTSCHAGTIKLQHQEWLLGDMGKVATGTDLIRLMQLVEGTNIDVHWLDDNHGNVFIAMVYVDGRYICEAVPKPIYPRAKIERTPADEAARQLMTRYVATIDGYMRTSAANVERVSVIDHRRPTLNNKFVIKGMENYEPSPEVAEALPAITEDELTPETSTGNSWDDKFKI